MLIPSIRAHDLTTPQRPYQRASSPWGTGVSSKAWWGERQQAAHAAVSARAEGKAQPALGVIIAGDDHDLWLPLAQDNVRE